MTNEKRKLELSEETLLQLNDIRSIYGGIDVKADCGIDCSCSAKDRPCSFKGSLPTCGGNNL